MDRFKLVRERGGEDEELDFLKMQKDKGEGEGKEPCFVRAGV